MLIRKQLSGVVGGKEYVTTLYFQSHFAINLKLLKKSIKNLRTIMENFKCIQS